MGWGTTPLTKLTKVVLFGNGSGLGCAPTKAISGFGGFFSAMKAINLGGGIIPQMLGMISTVAQAANGIAGTSRNSGVFGGNPNAGNGSANATDDSGADNNPCNCLPGYGSKPKPVGDTRPYFKTVDEAAVYWACKHRNVSRAPVEHSSLIYAVQVTTTKKSIQRLYATTKAIRLPDRSIFQRLIDQGYDPSSASPGINSQLHEVLKSGWVKIGHIHLHPYDPKDLKGQRRGSDNGPFREWDLDERKKNKDKYWYVLGIYGQLHGHYPKEMPPLTNNYSLFLDPIKDGISTPEAVKGLNFYSKQETQPSLRPCYKQ